jgi:ribosomal protein S10
MRNIFFLFIALGIIGCNTSNVNQEKPSKVVEAIFKAAKEKEFSLLEDLCDPKHENDKATHNICNLHEKHREQFIRKFSKAEISGEIEIEDKVAVVPVKLNPDSEDEYEIRLVKRDKKWYLYKMVKIQKGFTF